MLPRVTRGYVEGVIDRSLKRLRMERLDLVQFHWWDYAIPAPSRAAAHLVALQKAGKIDRIGATNFDTDHMLALIESVCRSSPCRCSIRCSMARPRRRMVEAAQAHGVSLLCYGTVAGGFLSDRWLGKPEPAMGFENRSLTKYKLVIDDFGGWDVFPGSAYRPARRRGPARQRHRHGGERSDADSAGGGGSDRRGAHARTFAGEPRHRGYQAGAARSCRDRSGSGGRKELEGDVFDLERDRHGRHGSIMKYNLGSGKA